MSSYLAAFSHHFQLPAVFFQNPYIAVSFPVICGGLIGYRSGTKAKQVYGRHPMISPGYVSDDVPGDLKQPPGKPPAALFGPVWTAIYGLTGFASYLARHNPAARSLYTASLIFNFGKHLVQR